MRASHVRTWLAAAGTLLAQGCLAQRAPVALLKPTKVLAQPINPAAPQGQAVLQKPASSAAATQPAAAAASHYRPIILPPLMLVNTRIIVSDLASIAPRDIADIIVYKGSNIPPGWRSATENGVVNLVLKQGVKIPSVSLPQLKRQQHLSGPVRYELDGLPLADTSLRIAADAIGKLEVRPASASESTTVLNIRMRRPKPKPTPPGIYIRGVAGW